VNAMPDSLQAREDRIRERAYHIWLDAGCPDGAAHDHWRMAEAQQAADAAVDEASDESFPASDPPSHTGIIGPQ
jgi:hypothetical protein